MPTVELNGTGLAPADVVAVARGDALVRLGARGRELMDASALAVQRALVAPEPAYGVSTGFGSLANVVIPPARREELQRALVRSHAAGMGPPVEREVVRAMMLLRARTLSMGLSGARPVVAERMIALLNAAITPVVPEHGSLGASGDLAPLAHCALALLGEGEVELRDERKTTAAEALAQHDIAPLTLIAKEGLACINGTDGMLGMLVLAAHDLAQPAENRGRHRRDVRRGAARHRSRVRRRARRPAPAAGPAAQRPQPPRAARRLADRRQPSHRRRPRPGRLLAALRAAGHRRGPRRPDACRRRRRQRAAQRDRQPDGAARRPRRSCGNFHGAPLAFACDALAIAIAEVGAIAERRTDRLLDASRSSGLPPFLAPDAGVNSGLMIAQYTQAAMVAENRRLAAPASVGSLPTSAMQEDHVSMGWAAARKLRTVVDNLARILAVELVCAARGIELRAPLQPAAGTRAALHAARAGGIDGAGPDRWLAPELAAADQLVRSGALQRAVEDEIGALA